MKSVIRSLRALFKAFRDDPLCAFFAFGVVLGFDLRHFTEFILTILDGRLDFIR